MPPKRFETGNSVPIQDVGADRLAREKELLLNPKVLIGAGGMLVERYGRSQEIQPGHRLAATPEVQVSIDDSDAPLTIYASQDGQQYGQWGINLVDPVQRTSAPWILFDNTVGQITDGNGSPIADPEGLQQVRDIIDAMEQQYSQALTETADAFDIRGNALKDVDDEITETEELLNELRLRRNLIALETAPIGMFQVTITSAWAKEGERSYSETIPADSLSAAVAKAIERFKVLNNRSDVQANSIQVRATSDGRNYYEVPREVVMPLYQAYSRSDREAIAIARLK